MSRDVSTWGGGDETVVPHDETPDLGAPAWVGRYEIGALLGRGGSGQVHRAHDRVTGHDVAVKFVSSLGRGTARLLRRELTALRLLDLPGVVRLLDDGEHGGQTFLVMELLTGGRFDDLATPGGWEDWSAEAVALLETLARVHFAGVLHRDLKPGNVLLDSQRRPVITDFGLAMGHAVETASLGHPEGTPRYMAPEQRRGDPCDERTDLFAMGVMFEEMLRDRPSPDAVRDVVAAMRSEDPADRPAGVVEVLQAIGVGTEALLGSVQRLPATSDLTAVRTLFDEPATSFLHVAQDAAAILMDRTSGNREAIRLELERWVRAGWCHWRDGRISLDRTALDGLSWERDPELLTLVRLSQVASSNEFANAVRKRAWALHLQGRSARAAGLLEAALPVVQGEHAERALLEQLVCVALALFREDVLRRAMYRAERAEATDLLRLVQGARLCWEGDAQRALQHLTVPLTGEPERSRLAYLVQACSVADPTQLLEVLRTARSACAGDPIAEGRWHIWAGNAAYAAGRYPEALEHDERAADALSEAPIWLLAALTNGGAAALEVPDLERAATLARNARDLAQRLRLSQVEVKAWWLERTARFRAGEALTPQVAHLEAAEVASWRYAAQAAITEGAVALAIGDLGSAQAMAARISSGLGTGSPALLGLAQALGAAAGRPVGAEERVNTDGLDATLRLQIAALHARSGGPRPDRSVVAAWIRAWPDVAPHQRLDVLSLRECIEAIDGAS